MATAAGCLVCSTVTVVNPGGNGGHLGTADRPWSAAPWPRSSRIFARGGDGPAKTGGTRRARRAIIAGVHAILYGLSAGYAVAVPLGAVGLLLLREGALAGWRRACAGAAGVATVDLGYALVAVFAGTAVAAVLDRYAHLTRVGGAVALAGVAVAGLVVLVRGARAAGPGGSGTTVNGSGGPVPGGPVPGGRCAAVFAAFVGLTAVNPLTIVLFVALATGLGQRLAGLGAKVQFAAGVFAASLSWQVLLACGGALLGSRLTGRRARTVTSAAGYLLVLVMAGILLAGG
jgi:arginine exporter protein ArgO